jgi:hypothetical protein
MPTILHRVRALRAGLTHLGDGQPLSRAALAILLLLDAFVLASIFDGLGAHTRQLATPEQRFPPVCREIVLDGRWSASARLERLALTEATSDVGVDEQHRPGDLHSICARLDDALAAVARDPELRRLLDARHRLDVQIRDLVAALAALTPAYETALLERVADGQRTERADVATTRKEVADKTRALDGARAERGVVDAALGSAPAVSALWARIDALQDADRDQLASDLRRAERWDPAKRLGMQLLFLLPLFAAFWWWNSVSLRRRRALQTLVSSHLLVVAAIPLLLQIGDAVYDVLPKRLLARVIHLLEVLRLVALWHYLVIVAAIAAALVVIVVVQRKLFSRERLVERRIAKGLCQECGKRLSLGARACPFCGSAQFRTCPQCNGAAHVHAPYCRECGAKAA